MVEDMKIVFGSEYEVGFGKEGVCAPDGISDYECIVDLTAVACRDSKTVMLIQDMAYHSEEWSGGMNEDPAPFIRMEIPEIRQLCKVLTAMCDALEEE